MIYARQSRQEDAEFEIVGVVEPEKERREAARRMFGIPREMCFADVAEAAGRDKFADAVFNCTMDGQHMSAAIPFLEKGYHMLLEKPIATNEEDAEKIYACAKRNGCTVMVCHVLRYAPFYTEIKRTVMSGEIGRIINIRMADQVSYYHMSVSYVRGKYGDPQICGSGMLLSKCSHDLDIMAWMLSGNGVKRVYSAGSLMQYVKENAPEGARERCLPDCPYVDKCAYSAKRLYVDYPQRWANRVWNDCGLTEATDEEKLKALGDGENRYGKCVYQTEMKIVDHQSVLVEFDDGATGTLSMTGGASTSGREIHITGTKGEIAGRFEDERFRVSTIAPEKPGGCETRTVDVSAAQNGDPHGGGDERLLLDFWALLRHEKPSVCCTEIEDSMTGQGIAFVAERQTS